jgi:hypothetical protein
MRTFIVTCLLLLATIVAASAGSVKVFIAPSSSTIPGSGKVSFDIYWLNNADRPAAIPALDQYHFKFSIVGPGSGTAGIEARIVDHPSPDRQISAHAIVRDHTTVEIDAKPGELVEVTAEFRGRKSRFKSNTVVLWKSRNG